MEIHGKERVTGITLAQVDDHRKPIPGTEEYYSCDTLLLSVGLIPENELTRGLGADVSRVTSGPEVNDHLETSVPGVFACGHVLHVHDLEMCIRDSSSTGCFLCAAAGHYLFFSSLLVFL